MPQFLPAKGSGKANPSNIVISGKARFTVLTQGLLRMEYAENEGFEDRATWFAARRNVEPQKFSQSQNAGTLVIETERLTLRYKGGAFSESNLEITLKAAQGREAVIWRPGTAPTGNLGGTIRTLDEVEGPRDLGLGILSKDGWAFIDDSQTILFTDEEFPWADARPKQGNLDWYFFGYQHDYKAGLYDLTVLGGKIPLPPKFALGSWYSRYWPYTSEEFLEIADQYKEKGFPLDVMVIDMDWHEDGWTGYTWNKKIIPDPKALLNQLHARGLKVTLNLHPHDGVGSHEASHQDFVRAMGLPEGSMDTVPFDITDRKFAESYFRVLLNPMEGDGVDFWWMDWQQGSKTKIEGVDPLMWLNYLHFRDRQRKPDPGAPPQAGQTAHANDSLRGLNFSRWAGLGDHRHPVHFSGDTHSNWEVLEFLAPFTATAGNVGAAYWSHDIGGHFATAGRTDPELLTRWIQYGAFSPVLRVHSSRDPNSDRRPWLDGEPFASAIKEAYVLRDQLAPYLYGAARHCYDTGIAPLRPMYLQYPGAPEAYETPNQFMFGEDILVAPAARPGFGKAKVAHVAVWFPEGDWYHLTTHQHFKGPLHTVLPLALEGMAVFARGGAAIPMKGNRIRLYPGAPAERGLYEDDGETSAYEEGSFRSTGMASGAQFTLGPSRGSFAGAAAERPRMALETLGGTLEIEGGRLDQSVSVALPAPLGEGTRQIFDRVQQYLAKARIALRQLEGGHAQQAGLKDIVVRLEHLEELFAGPEDRSAFVKVLETISERTDALEAQLALSRESGSEEALRVLAGVSMLALAKPSGDPSKILIEVEVRREAPASAPASFKISASNATEAGREHRELQAKTLEVLHFEWPVDFGATEAVEGEVEMRLESGGRALVLKERFSWKAGTIRQWQVSSARQVQIPEANKGEIAYPSMAGLSWSERRFDPAGVMRNIREFYDFKELFLCPEGEVFALAELSSPAAQKVEFGFGCEGKGLVWVNGSQVTVEQGSFSAELNEGPNEVLVRIRGMRRAGGGFGLSVRKAPSPVRFHMPKKPSAKMSVGVS